MVILTAFYAATMLVKIWQCNPRERIWDKEVSGRCINVSSLFNMSGIFNTVTDLLILLIPVKLVWNLRMKRKTKLGIAAVFTVGFW